jgi:CubicO group peptidase (beta-lactamase class C family)
MQVSPVLEARLARIVIPGVVNPFALSGGVLAACDADGRIRYAAAGRDAEGAPVSIDSFFPLASASKLATGLLLLTLVDEGGLDVDAPLAAFLPEARCAADERVTIGRLMSHQAGLPIEVAHDLSPRSEDGTARDRVVWAPGLRWPGVLAQACLATACTIAPGTVTRYSNVAFGLLGLVAERIAGSTFAELLRTRVFAPLAIDASVGDDLDRPYMAVADVSGPYSDHPVLAPYNGRLFRGAGTPWAGVGADVLGLLSLTRAYDERAGFLSARTAQLARTDRNGGTPGGFVGSDPFLGHGPAHEIVWPSAPWGLAIEVQGRKTPHWAPAALPESFGQIGSSGCIGWHDPAANLTWAMLGARTADSGWLLRHGAKLAQAAREAMLQAD